MELSATLCCSGLWGLAAVVRAGVTQGSLKLDPGCVSEVGGTPHLPIFSPPRGDTGGPVLAQKPS